MVCIFKLKYRKFTKKNGKTNASPTPKNKTKYKIMYTDKQTDKTDK